MALTKVTSNVLADDAVTTGKILDANVTTGKILDSAVTTGKITDNAITTGKLANDSVTNGKLANDSVTNGKVGVEFTTSSALTAAATIDVNFTAAQIFTLTPTYNTVLNITNPIIGISKVIIVTGTGNSYTLGFTVGGAAGTFNKIAGDYDDTSAAKNFVQVICVSATEFWYSISQIA